MTLTKLTLFGPPRLERAGQPVEVSRRKALAMLAYLAATGQPHSRDTLAALFWPEVDQRRARGNLRRALSDLNQEIGEGWLILEGETVALAAGDNLWLDVALFHACLDACTQHGHSPEEICPDCLPLLDEAAALYQADFLSGFTLRDSPEFDDWQYFEAESLRQALAIVLERLVHGYMDRQEHEAAIPYARRWLSMDPLHEPVHRVLMQLYAQSGQQAAALRQYEECVRLLDQEFGLSPELETTTLYEAIKAKRILEPFLKAETQGRKPRLKSDERGAGEKANERPPPPPSEPGLSLGRRSLPLALERYELLAEIGAGSFATVYRARDRELDRLVAFKELKGSLLTDDRLLRRFRQEAKLIARLDHPNIVTIHDVGQVQGQPFIIMRLIEGQSLAERLSGQGRMTWPEVLESISAVAAGLDYAHRRGILHRDLKPANILIDPKRGLLLSDFGLAKLVDENSLSLSRSREVVGTTHYIAPEVWDGHPATPQTDIYALGCILYEMLTGEKLFAGKTPSSVMRAHFQPLTLPENWPQDVPAGVADILKKVMARQPDERYTTATELVAALTGLADGHAVASEPPDDSSVLRRATQERAAGNYDTAIDLLKALLSHAPAHEAAHRELMTLYALAGRRHQALRQYKVCTQALKTELGVSPTSETETLYRQIVGGEIAPARATTPKSTWLVPAPIAVEIERITPLLDREPELEMIRTKISSAWPDQGETILLAGASGVGKTRLAYEALRNAAQTDTTTLVGAAYEQEGHLAYHPFIEAIDRYLNEQNRLPEENPITHYKPMGITDLQKENTALFKATALFLTRLASDGPVVLLLDDLHAADEASLSMFHYLARHTHSAPLILLATYRTDIAMNGVSPFGSLLNSLYRERLSEVIQLKPLSQNAGAQIIGHILEGEPDPALVKAIYEVAEGNPFFVQEITRSMLKADQLIQEQGQWCLPPGTSLRVPSELRDLLRERVQRLGPTVESTLMAAAVVGREFRFAVLRSITELPDHELLDALDDALAAHLIEETETGYRFQHSIIRHTLYDTLSRRRRAWLHTRTGEAIEAIEARRPEGLNPHIESLAFHYELSDRRDQALPYLKQAAQKATAIFALEIASDYLERALALMDEMGVNDPAQRWSILEQLGTLAKILADTTRAVVCYEEALALSSTDAWRPEPADKVRLHRSAARVLITAGRAAEAERHLESAMEVMADSGQASLDYANLLYDVALWHWHNNEHQEAFDAAQRSLDVAEKLDDVIARAQAYEMLALACHSLGEWQQGLNFEQQRSTLIGPNLDVTEAFDAHL